MIILTGGAGFIGSCFLWKLNSEGINDIIVVDNLGTSEKWRNLVGKKFKDYIQKDDFLRLVTDNKIPKATHIVHMGACSSTTLTDANYYIHNNYEYSKVLAQWAFKNNSHLLYASSAATYGDGNMGYSDDDKLIYKLRPLNMYGYSKQLFDLWILNNKYENRVTGIKFFNVFGPNEYHKQDMMSVICKTYKNVLDDKGICLFKSYRDDYMDGQQKRDFVYVKDCVDVMFHLFENPDTTGIYNLGTGKARTWNDVANAMFIAAGKKPKIRYIEMPDYLRPKYQYYTQAEMSKLRDAGCAYEFQSLEDSVKDYSTYLEKSENL